jgi:mRNA guanylyltransferase
MHTPIPAIPGEEVDGVIASYLSQHIASLCGLRGNMFPGAQPVSFQQKSLDMLETMNFWVCEKSDGVRLLILVVMNHNEGLQDVFLVSPTFDSALSGSPYARATMGTAASDDLANRGR